MNGLDQKLKRTQLWVLLLVWVLILGMPILSGNFSDSIVWEHIFRIWKEYSIVFGLFLINHFLLLPYLFFKERRRVYLLVVVLLIGVSSTVLISTLEPINILVPPPHRATLSAPLGGRTESAVAPEGNRDNRPLNAPEGNRGNRPLNAPEGIRGNRPLNAPEGIRGNRPLNAPEGDRDNRPLNAPEGIRGNRPFNAPVGSRGNRPPIAPSSNVIIMSLLIVVFDTGLVLFAKWMKADQRKLKIEKESVENKMILLQNQVSPHFFMNTLNNVHALIDIDTEEAKEAVIRLSKMMSYMLYETTATKVSLRQELDFIRSYVELMKLRFTEDIDIVLNIPKVIPEVNIPPLLIIAFVENAFKYGISYQSPSFVHIDISLDESRCYFVVRNSNYAAVKQTAVNSGIGIVNTENRLNLIYGDSCNLAIDSLDDCDKNGTANKVFQVKLNIPI